ncbi:MAG: beta-ketoacyl synthase N-terminal-like domain-containing protein [Desulfobacteraceae bacterium]
MAPRVVITAMGMVTSLGGSPEEVAGNVRTGRVPFQLVGSNPRVVAAPVADFDLRHSIDRFKNRRYLTRAAAMAVAAAVRAAEQAALATDQRESAGVFLGAGPNLDIGGECPAIQDGAMDVGKLSALWMLRFLPNTAVSVISQLTGIRGENLTVGGACAASLQAVGEAYRKIKDGYLSAALAGGGDSRLNPGALLAYLKAGALYRGPDPPGEAQRPFDLRRNGFVPGEGGAFFVLENARQAVARGATILAEVCGYGATLDGDAMTAPSSMFDSRRPCVLALKSWVGHLAAACGAVELALCLSAMQTGIWPWIRNLETPGNPDLNYLRSQDEPVAPGNLLLQNFGFGGQNAALVIRPWQP